MPVTSTSFVSTAAASFARDGQSIGAQPRSTISVGPPSARTSGVIRLIPGVPSRTLFSRCLSAS
jgi:hypothetical protein